MGRSDMHHLPLSQTPPVHTPGSGPGTRGRFEYGKGTVTTRFMRVVQLRPAPQPTHPASTAASWMARMNRAMTRRRRKTG